MKGDIKMKKVTAFYIEGCPYCKQAREALKELYGEIAEYSAVKIEWVDENLHPEISAKYDYYHVPSMFIEGEKKYEAHPGEKYEECRDNVRRVLEEALA